jgi:tetratricopeptide (TPR) repeat protein
VGSDHFLDAKQSAKRALALNPRNAEAHSALGYIEVLQLWNWEEGLRETQQAIALAPNDAEVANFAGDVYRSLGDFEQGTKWERRAIELDPLLPINHSDLTWVLQMQGRCQEAVAPGKKALELDPGLLGAVDALARAHICLGDLDRAGQLAEQLASADPTLYSGPDLRARIAIKQGRLDDARQATAELQRRARAGEMVNYAVAQLEVMLGDNEAAARSLALAYTQRDPFFPADDLWLLPEDWPDHPGIRATLDKPEIKGLFDMRRNYFKAQKMRGFK